MQIFGFGRKKREKFSDLERPAAKASDKIENLPFTNAFYFASPEHLKGCAV
jgi:hypothetical protein